MKTLMKAENLLKNLQTCSINFRDDDWMHKSGQLKSGKWTKSEKANQQMLTDVAVLLPSATPNGKGPFYTNGYCVV